MNRLISLAALVAAIMTAPTVVYSEEQPSSIKWVSSDHMAMIESANHGSDGALAVVFDEDKKCASKMVFMFDRPVNVREERMGTNIVDLKIDDNEVHSTATRYVLDYMKDSETHLITSIQAADAEMKNGETLYARAKEHEISPKYRSTYIFSLNGYTAASAAALDSCSAKAAAVDVW